MRNRKLLTYIIAAVASLICFMMTCHAQTTTCQQYKGRVKRAHLTITADKLKAMTAVGTGGLTIVAPANNMQVICPVGLTVNYIPGRKAYSDSSAKLGLYYDWYPSVPYVESTLKELGMNQTIFNMNFGFLRSLQGTPEEAEGRSLVYGRTADGPIELGDGSLVIHLDYFTIQF